MSFDELIETAQKAYMAEDFDKAVKYLIAANLKEPNARLLLNVAKSYEKKGDCVSALVYYRAFVRAPGAESSLVTAAKKSITEASSCQGWDELMAGRLLLTSEPSGATVSIDGKEVGTTPIEVAGYVEGPHAVFFERDGYESVERQIDLRPDTDEQLNVQLVEVTEEVVTTEPVEPVETVVVEDDSGDSQIIHYAIAGGLAAAGAGLLTVGLVTDLGIPDKYDAPRQNENISESEFDSLTSDRKGAVTRATIFYVIGGLLLGGGVGYGVYAVTSSGGADTADPSLAFKVGNVPMALAPAFGFDGAGVLLSGEF